MSAGGGASAETVANPAKPASAKIEVHILATGTPEFCDDLVPMAFEFCEAGRSEKFDFQFHGCIKFGKLAASLQSHKYDVALVQLHRTPHQSQSFEKREVLHRVQGWDSGEYLCWNGFELCHYLHSVHGIPVIMVSDTGGDQAAERVMAVKLGARALFPWMGINQPKFDEILGAILQQRY